MLTPFLKAEILRKTGFVVPAIPDLVEDEDAVSENRGFKQWIAAVEAMFVTYVAARAAKSLRDSEEARQLDALRQSASAYSSGRMQAMRA